MCIGGGRGPVGKEWPHYVGVYQRRQKLAGRRRADASVRLFEGDVMKIEAYAPQWIRTSQRLSVCTVAVLVMHRIAQPTKAPAAHECAETPLRCAFAPFLPEWHTF